MIALENKLTALKIAGRVAGYNENDFYKCYTVFFDPSITLNKIKSKGLKILNISVPFLALAGTK